ncbi:dnaJ homolog subfamily C member 27 isoform X3 [Chamaea fasciata]|uniref:dnaJ homolog subfamily C member 27 isoform X3 n=1 Tax=Chamaea fasciata TaxID=190680 RepID=UPI00336AB7EB
MRELNCWELLGIVGNCWELLGIVGNCWELLGIVGNCWELLGIVGNCWELLGIPGKCGSGGIPGGIPGQSCIIKRYCEKRFVSKYLATIGIDYGVTKVQIRDREIKVNIFDMAGHPFFYEVRNEFYKDTQGVLLVYDVGSKESFDSLDSWLAEMKQELGPHGSLDNVVCVVCANKGPGADPAPIPRRALFFLPGCAGGRGEAAGGGRERGAALGREPRLPLLGDLGPERGGHPGDVPDVLLGHPGAVRERREAAAGQRRDQLHAGAGRRHPQDPQQQGQLGHAGAQTRRLQDSFPFFQGFSPG